MAAGPPGPCGPCPAFKPDGVSAWDQRSAASIFPPSTVNTAAVVLRERARSTKALATSSALTSRFRRFPAPEVLLHREAARRGPFLEQSAFEEPGMNAVGVHDVGADSLLAVLEGVLPGERERCRLGEAVGPEVPSRIHRLFGGIEQQYATRSLGGHHTNGVLGHRLVSEKVELEALPQNTVGDVPDPPLPRRARVGHHDVETAEQPADSIEGAAHRAAIGDVACDPDGAFTDGPGDGFRG